MNEDHLNMQIRKFLKKVGIQSQREIENAVQAAVGDGRLSSGEALTATMKLSMPGIGLDVTIDGEITIE
jgi:hypothetical protein